MFTVAEQIAEVEREIAIRERVYARWVKVGKTSQAAADLQQGRMKAALDTLKRAMPLLADRDPGALPTGEVFGPAKVKEVERARILGILGTMLDSNAYYQLVQKLQSADSGKTERHGHG